MLDWISEMLFLFLFYIIFKKKDIQVLVIDTYTIQSYFLVHFTLTLTNIYKFL